MLNVSRSSFYAWRGHVDSAATTRRGELATLITAAFNDSRQTYGCRRITTIGGDKRGDIEDGINRNFTSRQPGTRLVGDITYLRTDQGWMVRVSNDFVFEKR